ncbi:transcription initiation factor IIB family protein [Halomarina halobia]|uniref:Transcription initiation factor IIB n=1 Tax=Halomarina halobia TaxID=3033386 RepID=A0ABD6AFP8_9EURY|nr:transcription initiation factor IIB family protein [Halomarina sp. PSR21]
MATRDIYETGFDEDVQHGTTTDCPECSGQVQTTAIETVCEDCGLVIDEQQIDHGPEWRFFADDETTRERTGAPLTPARHDRGLSTTIGRKRDGRGRTLSGAKQRQLGRLRREQTWARWQSTADQNLAHGLGEVRRIASALDFGTSIRDQACTLFRSAQNEDLLRGRSIEAIAAASVYGACRCNGLSRTLEETDAVARCERSELTTAYNTLNSELGLPAQPVTPRAFLPKLASDLDLRDRIRHRARELAEVAAEAGISNGSHPAGVAAACLYTTAQECEWSVTQTRVAEAADVSTVTLRTHYEAIIDALARGDVTR